MVKFNRTYIIAEIGINHNGDLNIAKQLIELAKDSGADAVKFQKRDIDLVYTTSELEMPRESPFGSSNRDLKEALEFGDEEYDSIDRYCKGLGIDWFASCWDINSVKFMDRYKPRFHKVASALITDIELLDEIKKRDSDVIVSTGMSTLDEIDACAGHFDMERLCIQHATSTYPSNYDELNLLMLKTLQERFSCPIGYSGHESGVATSVAAVALGAQLVERHITLDRAMFGSDQSASLGPTGFRQLCRDIRLVERAMGDGIKRVYESELPIKAKLRKK